MNSVQLVGRMVRDPEIRYSTGENATASCRFTVAVNRRYKNKETNQYDADFIGCVSFGATSEFINKYFKKGDFISINGRITTGNYVNKDGVKVYTTDVTVENAEFAGGKGSGSSEGSVPTQKPNTDDFMNIPDAVGDDEDLPF